MNKQESHGDFSPNVIGPNNRVNKNIKLSFGIKTRYTLLGFIIGIASSYVGSYLYENYNIVKTPAKSKQEVVSDNQYFIGDSLK